MPKRVHKTTFTVVALMAALSAQAAADLVRNGSFATGDFSGWSLAGDQDFSGIGSNSDGHYAYFGPISAAGGISQTLSTIAGRHYTLSFLLANLKPDHNSMDLRWNGQNVFGLRDAEAFASTPFTFQLVATGTSTELSFLFRHRPSYYQLTGVSAVAALAPVPEPASFAMLLAGLGVGGVLARRRRWQARPADAAAT